MAPRFLIAPYDQESGLQNNIKPWLIPDTAFAELNNAYVWRGRVRKRFGSKYLANSSLQSRLRVKIGTSDKFGNIIALVPNVAGTPIVTPAIGQLFSCGTEVYTLYTLAGAPLPLLRTGAGATPTFDRATSLFTVVNANAPVGTDVYYYPSLPVMGLLTKEADNVNEEITIGFDTKFAYEYINGWERLDGEITAGASVWSGANYQFFWAANWTGTDISDKIFFVTNGNANEANFMRRFDGTNWENFRPPIDATPHYLLSSLILVPFKNRLLAFNTYEGTVAPGTNYPNRCRYSQLGSPLQADAWRSDIPGKGGFIDASTTEAIITVEFIKDRLIVYFERSTWELVYTGNQVFPFTWQKINTELGAESTFSIVSFDNFAFGVGNVGIMQCNGANVSRIDDKIPDEVFKIHNIDNGVKRVYGIRDYYTEMVYWAFPSNDASATFPFPNRVLLYNYRNNTWSFAGDSITCFGYFQPVTGVLWSSTIVAWSDSTTWASGTNIARFREVVAGNQEGFTFICDSGVTTNSSVLQVTHISVASNIVTITCIDHNLRPGDYIYLEGIVGTGTLTDLNDLIFQVYNSPAPTSTTFTFVYDGTSVLTGVYAGGGLISRVSNIVIRTKEYNFFAQQGRNAYISKVDFLVDKTDYGQMTVNFYDSTSRVEFLQEGIANGVTLGTATLDTFPYTSLPLEESANRLWHPVYLQAEGNVVQMYLKMNDEQMRDTAIRTQDFQMHAMMIHAQPTTSRLE